MKYIEKCLNEYRSLISDYDYRCGNDDDNDRNELKLAFEELKAIKESIMKLAVIRVNDDVASAAILVPSRTKEEAIEVIKEMLLEDAEHVRPEIPESKWDDFELYQPFIIDQYDVFYTVNVLDRVSPV